MLLMGVKSVLAVSAALLLTLSPRMLDGQTLEILYSFTNGQDGAYPVPALVLEEGT